MMLSRMTISVTAFVLAMLGVSQTPKPVAEAVPTFNDDQTGKLLAMIRPSEGEDPFETIPWQTNLWDARKLAAKEGKPLLLWEMDGHPLGCG